jgi:acetolactate synthase-1/3 small subunit
MQDRPGVLNRVSTLFRRRNYNIESLSVGHSETPDISRMTIVVNGDNHVVDQVVKQLQKLINVTHVMNVSKEPTVVRELALIKVKAANGARSEVTELVSIFRAKVIDVAPASMTVEITGPEEKVDSLVELLRPFGIEEMARTGRVAMVRGSNGSGSIPQ